MMMGQKPSLCKSKFAGQWEAKSQTIFVKPETREESVVVHAMARACPKCGSPEYFALGELGLLFWVRCRACGWDFAFSRPSIRTKPNPGMVLAFYLAVFVLSIAIAIVLSILVGNPHLPYTRSAR